MNYRGKNEAIKACFSIICCYILSVAIIYSKKQQAYTPNSRLLVKFRADHGDCGNLPKSLSQQESKSHMERFEQDVIINIII